ncbi:transglutaminase-like domain-containing protein [bacterium]|nr:transglutaminase-like domain-containing protein [bacterium]
MTTRTRPISNRRSSIFNFRLLALALSLALPSPALAADWTPWALGYTADMDHLPAQPILAADPVIYNVEVNAEFHVRDNPDNETLIVTMPLPADTDSQKVQVWRASPPPAREWTTRYGYRYAQWELGPGYPGERLAVKYEANVELRKVRYEIDPTTVGTLDAIPEDIRRDYLADGPYYRLDKPIIRNAAAEAVAGETNALAATQRVWNYVRGRLFYKGDGRKLPAPRTLLLGHGSCTEYSFSMIALCRAAGIPARYVSGTVARNRPHRVTAYDLAFHKVAQAYIPNHGWVTMESSRGDGVYGVDLTSRLFATSSGKLFNVIYEPEREETSLDPRNNVATYAPSGAGKLDYYGVISSDWKVQEVLRRAPSMELDLEPLDGEGEPDDDPGSY